MDGCLHHITLHTGHSRPSPRSEVDESTLDALCGVLRSVDEGDTVEFMGAWSLRRLDADGEGRHTRQWAILSPAGEAVIVLACAMKSRPGAALWRHLHETLSDTATRADELPPAPWLAAYWDQRQIVRHMDAAGWLGDAERCLTWAWIEACYER